MTIPRSPAGGDAYSGAGGQAIGGNKDESNGAGNGGLLGIGSGMSLCGSRVLHVLLTRVS